MRRTVALRIRTSSIGSWLIFERSNRTFQPSRYSSLLPGHHLRQGELMRSIKRGCPGVHCLFSLGRNPVQQHSISREATEEFVGIELFVPGFEGERKRSTRPAMRVLTAGTARACIHDLRFQDHFLDDQLPSTPHLYFLYFGSILSANQQRL